MKKQIAQNVFWLICEKIITIILVFYVEGVISGLLSKADYGKWIYSINLVLLLGSLSLIVGAEVLVPTLSKYKKISQEIIFDTFIIRFFFGLLAYVATICYSNFFIDDTVLQGFLNILALVLLFNESFGVVTGYFQSKVNIFPVTIVRLIGLGFRALIVTIILKFGLEVSFIPWARVAETIVSAIGLFLLYYFYRGNLFSKFSKSIAKILFFRGLFLWPSLMMMYFFQRIDRFFVEHYLGFDYLAVYGISIQIIEQATLLFAMVIQSIAPIFIYQRVNSKDRLNKLGIITILMLVLSVVSIIMGYFMIPLFVDIVYGEKYFGAISITIGLLPSLIFYSIDMVLTQYFYAENLGGKLIYKWILMALITCLSYWGGLGILGVKSAALIFNINYIIMLVITLILFKKYIYKTKNITKCSFTN
ncbi:MULTISPECIES: oligosaccharide flippase family protein [unclassified Moraxella]|uniref:oligosaccharide flippase family protein n=1 Tax=unclassified Moraxella TaxID=2685852 RepID=UPI003AF784F1